MLHKKLFVQISIRVLFIVANAVILSHLFVLGKYPVTQINLLLFLIVQGGFLIFYLNKVNRDLNRFFSSIINQDYSIKIKDEISDKSFLKLRQNIENVKDIIEEVKISQIEHYEYLKNVVSHVGVGILSYDRNEKVDFFNPAGKLILDIEKAIEWLNNGAQPTDTVRTILSYKGVLYKNHLLKGVKKGAMTEEQAEAKFQAWLNEKEAKIANKVSEKESAEKSERKQKLEAEAKVKESRAAELAKKRAEEAGIAAEEAASKETAEETPVKATEEVTVETPKKEEEKVEEAPAKEEKAKEVAAEEPKAEEKAVKEETPAEETTVEEPKAEEAVAEEAPAKEPKAEKGKKKEE